MDYEYIIIGGGVAGLCAGIRLGELGRQSLIIESGDYPSHKVCGEFFSPSCLSILERWDIQTIKIQQAEYYFDDQLFIYPFPVSFGSLSHYSFDPLLVERATKATILTNTKVIHLENVNDRYVMTLSNGEKYRTENLIIATGKLDYFRKQITEFKYQGIKAHFEGNTKSNSLKMFLFKDCYLGMSPIEHGKTNIACLVKMKQYKTWNSPSDFIKHLRSQNKELDRILSQLNLIFNEWMTAPIPHFGIKAKTNWENVYFIGDAIGAIPPATGNGLALAITSGVMAAEFAMKKDYKGYYKTWKKQESSKIFFGKLLHHAVMHPKLIKRFLSLGKRLNWICDKMFYLTR